MVPAAGSKPPQTPLTDALRAFAAGAGPGGATVGELVQALRERGTAVLILLLAAPFVPPVPLPGLSLPFGVALALLGVRLGLRRGPWLPRFLRRRPLQPRTLEAMVRGAERVAQPIERVLRPRWRLLVQPPMEMAAGLAIVLAAVILFPPFPMPGANSLPSIAIVLLALGLMERDGAAVAAGYCMLFVAYFHLYLWWEVVVRLLARWTA
jgi:hypothetical protein